MELPIQLIHTLKESKSVLVTQFDMQAKDSDWSAM